MPTLPCRGAANLAQPRKLADVPSLSLDAGDAAQLAEMLQFLSDWLTTDPSLEASLNRFVGHPAYGMSHLPGRPGPVRLPAGRQRR
jgi:hypothetical protein